MKYFRIVLCLAIAGFIISINVSAQTASTICLDELKAAFKVIDQRDYLHSEKTLLAEYSFTYQLQVNPNDPPVTAEETFLATNGTIHHTDPDNEIYSNATEAFVVRPNQMVIYNVGPMLQSVWLIDRFDPGLLDYCTVTECNFLKPDGADTTLKEYKVIVSAEGQAKYKITSMLVHTNPVRNVMKRVKLVYSEGAKYVFGDFKFRHIHEDAFPGMKVPEINTFIYDTAGKLQERFNAFQVMDRR